MCGRITVTVFDWEGVDQDSFDSALSIPYSRRRGFRGEPDNALPQVPPRRRSRAVSGKHSTAPAPHLWRLKAMALDPVEEYVAASHLLRH
jgi:hypothetical protein